MSRNRQVDQEMETVRITQLVRRIQRLEVIATQRNSDPLDLAGAFERRLAKLSPSDRNLLEEAHRRSNHPDCPEDLEAVWVRWEAAVAQANAEDHCVCNQPSDWWL